MSRKSITPCGHIFLVIILLSLSAGLFPEATRTARGQGVGADQNRQQASRAEPKRDELVGAEILPGQLVVTVHKDAKRADLEKALKSLRHKAAIVEEIAAARMYLVEVPADAVHECRLRLGIHPYVEGCGLNKIRNLSRTFNDPALKPNNDHGWNLRRINVNEAWDITTGGAKIAIVDSGVKLDHEELVGKLSNPYSVYTRSASMQTGLVKVVKKGVSYDRYVTEHGTHVAATAAGLADNAKGSAGISPDSTIVPIQALNYFPKAQKISGHDWALVQSLNRAMNEGAKVINYSIGSSPSDKLVKAWRDAPTPEAKALAEAQINNWVRRNLNDDYLGVLDRARRESVIIVKSAGNENLPAKFDPLSSSQRVVCVAAMAKGDARASFSNYGDYTTVSAPGTEIWNAYANPNEPYGTLQGTSMAAPHVTGVVALMKTVDPDVSRTEAAQILIETGEPLTTDKPVGPLINAAAAVKELKRRRDNNVPRPEIDPPLISVRPNPCNPVLPRDGVAILRRPRPWRNPDVRRLIDLWLSISIPLARNPRDNAGPIFWDRFGRVIRIQIVYTILPPDYANDRYRWLWDNAQQLNSSNYGSLSIFVNDMLKKGVFNPAPPPTVQVADQPMQDPSPANGTHAVTTTFSGLATTFDWKQSKGADTALVTFNMNGAEGNVLKQFGLPAKVTVTAKRSGATFVVPANNPMSTALTAAGANASKTAGGTPAKINVTMTFTPTGKKVAIQTKISFGG